MTVSLSGPLEARPNRSRWANLLDIALPALDHAMPGEVEAIVGGTMPRWSLGGGTALALRIGHRISDDIDVFLSGVGLKEVSPNANPVTKTISGKFDWPGHYVKYYRPDGEIDFLSSALQTKPGFTVETFRGRAIALETVDEVMVKKLRYRSEKFTLRDAFDLACVLSAKPETLLTLAKEVPDVIPRATLALSSLTNEKVRSAVRPTSAFEPILDDPIDRARAGLREMAWLHDNPILEQTASTIAEVVQSITWFEAGSRAGLVHFGWDDLENKPGPDRLAVLQTRRHEAKAAILNAWRASDAKAYDAWDSRGRPARLNAKTLSKTNETDFER